MAQDDYNILAKKIDSEFTTASVRIDNSNPDRKTLIADLYNQGAQPEDIISWVTENKRNIFGYASNRITIRTEVEGERVLFAIE